MTDLRGKPWKWRHPDENRGTAVSQHWIPGDRFLTVIERRLHGAEA